MMRMASRTVFRLAWKRSHNSRSVGRLSPTPNCPSEMRPRILSTMASTADGIELRTMEAFSALPAPPIRDGSFIP
ncbi:hypothetical protein D3C72_2028090 [compost metagenome]